MMPDSLAQVHEDGACETPAEERAREDAIEANSRRMLSDSKWWDSRLEGVNHITAELPYLLERIACRVQIVESGKMTVQDEQRFHDANAADVYSFVNRLGRLEAREQALSEYERHERVKA